MTAPARLPMLLVLMSLSAPALFADWKSEAAARIEQHRKSDLVLTVRDRKTGEPVRDLAVSLKMKRHAYLFGTAVNEDLVAQQDADGERYRREILDNFNASVLENHQKWKFFEDAARRPATDAALEWIRRHGLAHRGHAHIWQTFKYGVMVPKDIHLAAQRATAEDLEHIRRRSLEHVTALGRHYRGQAVHWDVLNEQVEEHELTKVLHAGVPPSRAPILVDWFRAAKAADPSTRLYINDYHILVGDFKKHKDVYEDTIRFLIEEKAPLEGIGFQGHFHGGALVRTPEQTWETLERFGRFGIPMAVTEFDMFAKGWGETLEAEEAAQGEFFEQFLTTFYSHPGTEAFLIWGFWDGRHWAGKGVFFRKDWTPKPAYAVWRKLVQGAWRSDATARTGADGTARVRLFHGDYEATLPGPDGPLTFEIRLRPDNTRFDLQIGVTEPK